MSVNVTTASKDYLAATRVRRTCYNLTPKSTIPDEQIVEIVKHAVLHTPTAFNCQPLRAVVLLGECHKKLWDIVLDSLRARLSPDRFATSETKVKGSLASGYGTVLYFTDEEVIETYKTNFASYKDHFEEWADNSQGILQATVWTALAVEGIRASLQHYHPLINDAVRKEWNIPTTWKFSAQAPFGVAADDWEPPEKQVVPLDERVKVFQ